MIFDTKWNVGDFAWGVFCRWEMVPVPCDKCDGKGYAEIPGSRVSVTCRDCDGSGTTGERQETKFFAEHNPIRLIEITIDKGGMKIAYLYDRYFKGFGPFLSIHEAEEDARKAADERQKREDAVGKANEQGEA